MRASGVPRHSRTSTKPNEIPRELGVWCEKCNNRLVELKRQVMRMILPEIQGVLQKDRRLKNNAVRLQTTITFLFRNHCSAGWNLKSAFTLSYWNVLACEFFTTDYVWKLLFIYSLTFPMRWQKCKVMWGTANHFTTSDNSVQVQSNLKNAHNFAKLELTLLETGNLKYDNFICWLHKTFLRTSSLRQLNNSFRNSYFSVKIRQKFESATLKNSCLERNLTPRSTSWKCYIICWVNERYTSIVMILITKCLLIAKANNLFIS